MALEILTLEEIKAQTRVDIDDEDDLLTTYGEAAERQIIGMTRRSVEELIEIGAGAFPPQLRVAMLMFAAHLYRQREAVAPGAAVPVPYGIEFMTRPFTRLVHKEKEGTK